MKRYRFITNKTWKLHNISEATQQGRSGERETEREHASTHMHKPGVLLFLESRVGARGFTDSFY